MYDPHSGLLQENSSRKFLLDSKAGVKSALHIAAQSLLCTTLFIAQLSLRWAGITLARSSLRSLTCCVAVELFQEFAAAAAFFRSSLCLPWTALSSSPRS